MQYCISCGKPLKENAVFCANCGTKVEALDTSTASNGGQKADHHSNSSEEVTEKISNSFSNAKESIQKSSYYNYFKMTAKNPSESTITEGNNGWIQLLVMVLFSAAAFAAIVQGIINIGLRALDLSFFSSFANDVTGQIIWSIIPRVLIASAAIYLIFILVAFGAVKLTNKTADATFTNVLNEFSSLFTPNIILLVIATLLALIIPTFFTVGLAIVLAIVAVGLSFLAFNYFVYHKANTQKIDKLYVLFIANITLIIILSILFIVQVIPIFEMIDDISRYLN